MSPSTSVLGASGLSFLLHGWTLGLKMLVPFLFLGTGEMGGMLIMKKMIIFITGFVLVVAILVALVLYPKQQKAQYEVHFFEVTQMLLGNTEIVGTIVSLVSRKIEEEVAHEAKRSKSQLSKLGYFLQNPDEIMQQVQVQVKRVQEIEEALKIAEENEKLIMDGMKQLKKCPKDYEEAYGLLIELYSTYTQIYVLAKTPSSSGFSLSRKFDDLMSSFLKTFSKLRIYLPSMPETTILKPKIKD